MKGETSMALWIWGWKTETKILALLLNVTVGKSFHSTATCFVTRALVYVPASRFRVSPKISAQF